MAVYEVILRFQDREEVRLTDRALEVGTRLEIEGAEWLVESEEAQDGLEAARYICVEPRRRSRKLRASSSTLIGGSNGLRKPRVADDS
jgi:hypothetical protein